VVEDLELSGASPSWPARPRRAPRGGAARQASDFAACARRRSGSRAGAHPGLRAAARRRRAARRPFDGQVLEVDLDRRWGSTSVGPGLLHRGAPRLGARGLEVPEERIGRVRLGQPVVVKVMSYPTRAFRGRVTEIGWEGEPTRRHGALPRARGHRQPGRGAAAGMTARGARSSLAPAAVRDLRAAGAGGPDELVVTRAGPARQASSACSARDSSMTSATAADVDGREHDAWRRLLDCLARTRAWMAHARARMLARVFGTTAATPPRRSFR